MQKDIILALDQGTTSSRALLFDRQGRLIESAQFSFRQIYPQPGWVEHDPTEILSSQLAALTGVLIAANVEPERIAALGITNQRETTLIWDRASGQPIANAIVWQCRRTAELVEQLCADPAVAAEVTARTGLVPDAYFSATKIAWLLDHVEGARARAERGELAFGTVDSWLAWSLSGGATHATDVTNASRTMLYNIHTAGWDPWLLELFGVPEPLLPEVRPSAADYGLTAHPSLPAGLRIAGMAGDQQAALFGQRCFELGDAKNTLGTGAFLLMHTGDKPCLSANRLVTTVAASAPGRAGLEYALEGSVFVAGALVQWLRDEMGLISTAAESEQLAASVPDSAGVYVVPAFTGMGAPWWDSEARGAVLGLTRGAGRQHIVRAGLESIAYQSADLIAAFEADAGVALTSLKADGGAAANGFLMQFMADLIGLPVSVPESAEATGLGAAFLAGLTVGCWQGTDELLELELADKHYQPRPIDRAGLMAGWHKALSQVLTGEAATAALAGQAG